MRAGELKAKFGIADVLDFAETEHGLVRIAVSLGGMLGEAYLQGAHVTAWQPAGERPVLFTSPNSAFAPGKAIRGGIPLIFPWFGANRQNPAAPQHGFVRAAPWHLDAVEQAGRDALSLSFSLADSDVGSTIWPEPFRAVYTVTFGPVLSLRLAVENRGAQPFVFEEALHTYFAVSDIAQAAVAGLAGAIYLDKTDSARRKTQTEPLLKIARETDSVYLDTPPQTGVEDEGWGRHIVIDKEGAASSVVWNPWAEKAAAMADLGDPAWRGMVCLETGNIADNEIRLAPAARHEMSTTISVAPL